MVESHGGQAIANRVAVAEQAELRTKKNEIRLVVDVGPLGGVEWLTGAEPLSQAGHRV